MCGAGDEADGAKSNTGRQKLDSLHSQVQITAPFIVQASVCSILWNQSTSGQVRTTFSAVPSLVTHSRATWSQHRIFTSLRKVGCFCHPIYLIEAQRLRLSSLSQLTCSPQVVHSIFSTLLVQRETHQSYRELQLRTKCNTGTSSFPSQEETANGDLIVKTNFEVMAGFINLRRHSLHNILESNFQPPPLTRSCSATRTVSEMGSETQF